ncbi:hypothetical protein RK59_000050, partial [Shigella flexneri]
SVLRCFHLYLICIDKDLLVENLGGDEALANQTIRAFTEAALKVSQPVNKTALPAGLMPPGRWQKKAPINRVLWRQLSMNPLMAPVS